MAVTSRVRRSPINGVRNKLTLPKEYQDDKDHKYRFAYDTDTRIDDLREQGYEVVTTTKQVQIGDKRAADPTPVGSVVTTPSGPNKLVLMRIKKEYWDEDRATEQTEVDKSEQTLKAPSGLTGTITIEK
jgi:hypothetical protein